MERKRSKRLRSLAFGRQGEQEGLFELRDVKGRRSRLPDSPAETSPMLPRPKEVCSTDPRIIRELPKERLKRERKEETAFLGSFLLDAAGSIQDTDEMGADLIGAGRELLLLRPFLSFVSRESQVTFSGYLKRIVAQGKAGESEITLVRVNGTSFHARIHSTPFLEDGTVKEVYAVVFDGTRHGKAVEAFREGEERYRIVVENSSDGMMIVSAHQTILYVNPRWLQMFGYPAIEDLDRPSIGIIVHPDDRERVLDIARRRHKGEHAPARYEFKGLHKDGSIIHIEAHGTRTLYMKEEASLVLLRDVTERRRAEDERHRLSLIVEHAPEMILVVDNVGTVQYANVAFLRNCGRGSEELIGRHVCECTAGEDGSNFYEALWTRLQRGRKWTGRMTLKRQDGGFR